MNVPDLSKNKHVEDLVDQIDASIFSGDSFIDRDMIDGMRWFLERWNKEIDELEEILEEN